MDGRALGTGRLKTGYRPVTGVKAVNRPMTKHGLNVLRPDTSSQMRTIQDKSYFMNEIKQKSNMISAELNGLEKELNEGMNENSQLSLLESQFKKIQKELSSLQDKLMNLNLVVNSLHKHTDVNSIEEETKSLNKENNQVQKQLDQIFAERTRKELEISKLTSRLEKCFEQMNQLAGKMPIELQENVRSLQQKFEEREKIVTQIAHELKDLGHIKEQKAYELMQVPNALEYLNLLSARWHLETQKEVLTNKLNEEKNVKWEEEKTNLLDQVKKDISSIRDMEKTIETYKQATTLTDTSDFGLNFEDEKIKKYMEAIKKHDEMKKFLETYNEKLEQMSTREKDTKDSMDTLKQQVSMSLNSESDLVEELKKKQQDQEKIHQLEQKVQSEIVSVAIKKESLEKEISQVNQQLLSIQQVKPREQIQQEIRTFKTQKEMFESKIGDWTTMQQDHVGYMKQFKEYDGCSELEAEIEQTNEENRKLQEEISIMKAKTNVTLKSAELTEITTKLNRQIIQCMAKSA